MRNDSFEHKGTDKEAELQNHLEEAYLRLMMQKYMEQYGEELLEEEKNLPDSVPKQPTEAQIQQLKDKLAQAAQKSAPPKRRRIAKRLIPVAAVLIALFLATLANAGARSKFFNFFNVNSSISTEYGSQSDSNRKYVFNYIPDGFSEHFYEEEYNLLQIYFVNINNEDEYIFVNIGNDQRSFLADTEESENISPIKINGFQGEFFEKNQISTLVWTDDSTATTFLIQSTIKKEELVKVAEGITTK